MPLDLTAAALEGYHAPQDVTCPYYRTSPNGSAWHVGRWMRANGKPAPRNAATSRGHRLRVDGVVLAVNAEEVTLVA